VRITLIAWEERDGEGGARPDGWSLHRSEEDIATHLRSYWARVPNPLPATYSRPLDQNLIAVEISDRHPLAVQVAVRGSVRIPQYDEDRLEIEWVTGLKWPGTMQIPEIRD
jgi:hypothetical protein